MFCFNIDSEHSHQNMKEGYLTYMENSKEVIMSTAAVVVFCLALSGLIWFNHLMNQEITCVKQQLYEQHAIYPNDGGMR